MLQTRFTLALVWGVVAASFAMAQSLPPAAPATLTIAQAVDEAVRRNCVRGRAENERYANRETALIFPIVLPQR